MAGLILEASPTTLRGDAQLRHFVESSVSSLNDPISPDFARGFITATSSTTVPFELVDLLIQELLKVPAHVWKEMFASLLEYDDVDELPSIKVPTLLIWGDADALITQDMQNHLADLIPGADLAVYPGLGQYPALGRPCPVQQRRRKVRRWG